MTIGESLRRFRKAFGVTQQQVADSVGVLKPAYQRYELGKTVPLTTFLIKLADAYNVSLDYLLGLSDEPQPPTKEEWELLKQMRAYRDKQEGKADDKG